MQTQEYAEYPSYSDTKQSTEKVGGGTWGPPDTTTKAKPSMA